MTYVDFTLDYGNISATNTLYDTSAIVIAIKTILLSKPGNFPMNPSIGMNIGKYKFEFLDETTISNIKSELSYQMGIYLPSISNIYIDVTKIDNGEDRYVGITVSTQSDTSDVLASLLLDTTTTTIKAIENIH